MYCLAAATEFIVTCFLCRRWRLKIFNFHFPFRGGWKFPITIFEIFMVSRDFEMEKIGNDGTELTNKRLDNPYKKREKKSDFNRFFLIKN